MGWLRKKGKQLRRGIKKIGRKIGKAFKSILKPFAKVFNKFGPLGSMAMMFILPGVGQLIAGWGSTLTGFASTAVKFVGNAINYVATAPQKIFSTITNGLGAGWDAITGASGKAGGNWFERFGEAFNESWTKRDVNSLFKFDYSAEGVDRLTNIQRGEGNLFGYKAPEVTTPTTGTETATTGTEVASPGAAGKIKDVAKRIGEKEIPVLGTVGDVASVGSTALGTYSTLAQYGVVGSDDPIRGGSGMGYAATDQLGSIYDQGPTIQPWSPDPNMGAAQNMNSYANVYNQAMGFPQGFDPMFSPLYGESFNQSYRRQLTA